MKRTGRPITFLVGLFALVSITPVAAHEHPPLVAGFERFARHGEVDQALAGEILLSELSCTACHASERVPAKRGPQLDSIARRVNKQWLHDYLAAPASVKPGTTMPDLLSGHSEQSKAETITALVAFLSLEFLGYQLDSERVPTFRYGGAGYRIEDRIVPTESGGLHRRIRLRQDQNSAEEQTDVTEPLWFRVIDGKSVAKESENQWRSDSGLSVQLLDSNHTPEQSTQWMGPLHTSEDLELIYQWQ